MNIEPATNSWTIANGNFFVLNTKTPIVITTFGTNNYSDIFVEKQWSEEKHKAEVFTQPLPQLIAQLNWFVFLIFITPR